MEIQIPVGSTGVVEVITMTKSHRLAMAQALLRELAKAEATHGRRSTTALRAKVVAMVTDLLA